ncbi:MAG: endonuclease III domain-containing protein [Acidobacteriota bacterium]
MCTVNCSWANTVRMVAALCERFGEPVVGSSPSAFTFPQPGAIADAGNEDLRGAKLGNRAGWIRGLARQVVEGDLVMSTWIGRTDADRLREELLRLKGIGPYSANWATGP